MKTKEYKQGYRWATKDYGDNKKNPLKDNPYCAAQSCKKYCDWGRGYQDGVDEIYNKLFKSKYEEDDRQEIIRLDEEFKEREEVKLAKKHAKTKRGKAESAGQNTLF